MAGLNRAVTPVGSAPLSRHDRQSTCPARRSHVAQAARVGARGFHFGIVNGGYTSLVAWLPAYYQQRGASVADSGSLLACMTVFQAASACCYRWPLRLSGPSAVARAGLSAQLVGSLGPIVWPDSGRWCGSALRAQGSAGLSR